MLKRKPDALALASGDVWFLFWLSPEEEPVGDPQRDSAEK